jgi:hypothetical protein
VATLMVTRFLSGPMKNMISKRLSINLKRPFTSIGSSFGEDRWAQPALSSILNWSMISPRPFYPIRKSKSQDWYWTHRSRAFQSFWFRLGILNQKFLNSSFRLAFLSLKARYKKTESSRFQTSIWYQIRAQIPQKSIHWKNSKVGTFQFCF